MVDQVPNDVINIMPQDLKAVVSNVTMNQIFEYQVKLDTNIQSPFGNKCHRAEINGPTIYA